MNRVGGVDGCPAGWLRVERTADKRLVADVVSTERLFAEASEFAVLTIDIPIGLTDREPRGVDRLARKLLGAPRASSVFPAPVRAALGGDTYENASALSFAACGKRLTKQAYSILSKIREVDVMLLKAPHLRGRVREVHPEVSFYFLNGGRPMVHKKKRTAGQLEREALLVTQFGAGVRELRSTVPRTSAAPDDIMDALVALWSAERVSANAHVQLRADVTHDAHGLRMEMVA